jgi:prephenate dehydrogenase
MRLETLAIVGVGLIGGSIGIAARRRGIADRIIGVDQHADTLQLASSAGLIDESSLDLSQAASRANLVVFCTPVDRIAAQVLGAAPHCRPGTLLTDVGSTKARIVAGIEEQLPPHVAFVGGHPLAGSEKQGPSHANPDLFVNRVVAVTPTARTKHIALAQIVSFWQSLGASVRQLSPEEHDDALALTSHLPHLVAPALAGILPQHWRELTASGFRDTTRLAASNPALWATILRSNRNAVLRELDRYLNRLQQFHDALGKDDVNALLALLKEGKKAKDEIGSPGHDEKRA